MRILMVCLGNICRSPLAQGIMEKKVLAQGLAWEVDSAGTASYHNGNVPDPRSVNTAQQNGIDISYQRARQFHNSDFQKFDLILAMDASNYNDIVKQSNESSDLDKIKMILNYAFPGENRQVPDPYYKGGFQRVYDMLDEACDQIINSYT